MTKRNDICEIYIIENNINCKIYIGQTWYGVSKRFKDHIWNTNSNYDCCVKLERAIKKYGVELFKIRTLSTAINQKQADALEKFFIKTFDSVNNGYNIRDGGSRGKLSNESRKAISEKLKGHTVSDETKKKISDKLMGKCYLTEESKKKIGDASRGNQYAKGNTLSKEHKENIASSSKNRIWTEESKEKLRVANTGKKHSDETKKKISNTKKGNTNRLGQIGPKWTDEQKKGHSEKVKEGWIKRKQKLLEKGEAL